MLGEDVALRWVFGKSSHNGVPRGSYAAEFSYGRRRRCWGQHRVPARGVAAEWGHPVVDLVRGPPRGRDAGDGLGVAAHPDAAAGRGTTQARSDPCECCQGPTSACCTWRPHRKPSSTRWTSATALFGTKPWQTRHLPARAAAPSPGPAPGGRGLPARRTRSRRPIRKLSPAVSHHERPLGEQLLLLALLLPPAGLIGLLVMHAVERRLDDADRRPGRVSSSDLSWQSCAQARAHRLRRPSADTHTSAG